LIRRSAAAIPEPAVPARARSDHAAASNASVPPVCSQATTPGGGSGHLSRVSPGQRTATPGGQGRAAHAHVQRLGPQRLAPPEPHGRDDRRCRSRRDRHRRSDGSPRDSACRCARHTDRRHHSRLTGLALTCCQIRASNR
jgi:hypothetical protein